MQDLTPMVPPCGSPLKSITQALTDTRTGQLKEYKLIVNTYLTYL